MAKTVGTRRLKIKELAALQYPVSRLMYCSKLGLNRSLVLHRNSKMITKIIENNYNDPLKHLQKLCCEMNGENAKTLIKDDKEVLVFLSQEKETEYREEVKKLWEAEFDVYLEPLKITEFPEEELGVANEGGIEMPYYEFVPHLFDHILVTDEEYTVRTSEPAKKGTNS